MVNRCTNLKKFAAYVAGLLILLNVFIPAGSRAQSSITFDTEYWFAAPLTSSPYWAGTAFRISAFDAAATVTINVPLNGAFAPKTVTVPANSTATVPLTTAEIPLVINDTGNGIMPTGVLIETDEKIAVYYEAGGGTQSPDLIPLKGSEALGTAFLVPMQQESDIRNDGEQGFVVLATEDNTQVTITPKAAITGRPAGAPFTVTLNRGQTYFAQTPGTGPGTSGSTVNADKPVAITIFSELMRYGGNPSDLGSEQIVPVSRLGTEYMVVRGYRSTTDIVYFTAVEDGTELYVNGTLVATLAATDTYELETGATDAFYVQASKNVTALQLSGIASEESFSLLPAQLGCNGSNIVRVVRANNGTFYVNIVSPVNSGFDVNGDASLLGAAAFTEIASTGWYYARIAVPSSLVSAGNPVIVSNTDPAVKFQMGVFHTNSGGARYGYFSSYAGITINFNQSSAAVCEGGSVTFTPSVLSSDPVVSYSWTGPNGFTSSEATLTLDQLAPLQSGDYILTVNTASCTSQASVNLTVNPAPPAPVSGGDQYECAQNPIQTLTATATVPASDKITWYDAATGGNVVADPSLSSVGTVTYYAEARSSVACTSLTRTAVSLTIEAGPDIDPLTDQTVCGPYILPAITGTNLSGNEAYFTAPAGGGDRYEAGDEFSASGTTTLYIYDESAQVANCAGQLIASPNTSMSEEDVHNTVVTVGENHFLYDGTINPAFWEGTGDQQIVNRPGLPSMVYMSTVGDLSLDGPTGCFGSQVQVSVNVDITNNSTFDAYVYSGRVSLINKATLTELQATHIASGFQAGVTQTISISASVPRADLEAGNIVVLIAVETAQDGEEKNWTLSNFDTTYEFIPVSTLACSDEESFAVTLGAIPAAPVSGGNQYVCAQTPVQTLTASATADAGATIVWYDAPAGGNVVTDPSLNTVGSVTYYAEATNGTCSSPVRTPVSLVIESGPDIDPMPDQTACGAFELPAITGTGLSGNEAYFTGPGGTGTQYAPGDQITAPGATQLYIYDKAASEANCAGDVTVTGNTTLTPADPLYKNNHPPYPGVIAPGFWDGTEDQLIQHSAPAPGQVYHTIVGDVSIGNTADCFGTEVEIQASVTVANQGPGNAAGYPGRLAIVNKATGQLLYTTTLTTNFPANATASPVVSGVVSLADLAAGHIAITISLETNQQNNVKNWLLSDFQASYSFIPASTIGCADEETFTVTVGAALPVPLSGGDQEEAATGQILTATATLPPGAPAGSAIVWYDAPTGGNVVADPSLSSNGSVTYYAEIQADDCRGPRTPVKLTLTPLLPEVCGNGIDDDGNGVADCDDPACNPYANYFANGSMESYTQCPNYSNLGTLEYVTSWKTSQPASTGGTGGQLMVNDPVGGCVSPRPAGSWSASTDLPTGSDGMAWGGMHGGNPGQGQEDFQNTLVAPLPAGTYTFKFSAGYLVQSPYTGEGRFRFYGVEPGEADFTTAHPLGYSPMVTNAISATDPTWKEYSFTFTSTAIYDRIYIVAYSGPTARTYMVFDGFSMSYNAPEIGFQNALSTCAGNAILEVTNSDAAWTGFQWYLDGTLIPGATGTTYQPAGGQDGIYTVRAVLDGDCLTAASPGIEVSADCPVPFVCNGSAYLVSTPGGGVPSTLSIVAANNPKNVFATLTPSIPGAYNGIGYNFEDNLIYGFAGQGEPLVTPGEILQIDGQGTVRSLGMPTSTQAGRGMDIWTTDASVNPNGARVNMAPGVVGMDNKFYVLIQTSNPGETYLGTVDLATMTYTTVRLSQNVITADLAFSPYDGMLYGIAGSHLLIRTNPANGNQQVVTPSSGTAPDAGAGGAWNDVQGRVYFYSNATPGGGNGGGRLYRYNPANGVFANITNVDPFPGFDATACFPTTIEKTVLLPAGGINPGDVVQMQFSIYNNQMLPMTYDFEDILNSSDLSWVADAVNPAGPGGGAVTISGQTLSITGIEVPPSAANGPLTFTVSVKIADNAAHETCYTNQATITQGGVTVYSDDPATTAEDDPTQFCLNPCTVMLTVGQLTCDPDNGTYSVGYVSNGDVISTAGTVDIANGRITGIPFGTDITVTASCSGSSTSAQVTGLTSCPDDCVQPDLALGQPLCGPGGTFIVSYRETTGAAITVTGGTLNADGTITGAGGGNLIVTASNGTCTSTLLVAPPVDCAVACKNPAISIGGTRCSADGSPTYELVFTALAGTTVASDQGVVDAANGIITGIPLGTPVSLTISTPTCPDLAVVVPPANCRRDFTSTKSVTDASGDGQAQAGEELTYTISVVNRGDMDLTGMTIADPIPAGTSYVDASADNGGTYDAASGTVNWTIDVPYGQTVDVSFKVTVVDDLTGIDEVANKATVTDPENPGDPEEPESPPVPTDPVRDFTAAKTVADANSDGKAQAGEELTYTISIENTGDETLTGMTIADPIPAGTSYVDASVDQGGTYDAASGTVNWTIDVPYGQTVDVNFKVTVGDDLTGIDEVANKATVTDPENPGDPEEPESPPVPTDPVRDFTAAKTVTDASGDGKAQAGEELTYTISIENTGDETLTGMTIADPIPTGTSYVDASADNGGAYDATAGAVNWTIDVPYGQTVDVTFRVMVGGDLTGIDEIANKATVTDPENPGDPKEPESPPVPTDPVRDFTAAKTVTDASGDGNAQAGEELTYTILIENTGDETLTGMTIADPIPAGTSYVDASADQGGTYDAASGTVNWTIDVPYGQTMAVSFRVIVGDNLTGLTEIANQATVTDPENPGTPEEPESPPVPTDPQRDFTSSKTVTDASGDGQAQAGEELTYTISIENTGSADLTGMTIADPIPSGTTYLDGSADNGGVFDGGSNALNWTVDIPYGTTLNVSFKITVGDDLTGIDEIANQATVTDPEDPDNPDEPKSPPVPTDPVRDFIAAKTVADANGDGNAQAGEELTYTILIENTGDETLTGMTIADPIPAGTSYVDASADQGGTYDAVSGTMNWTIDVPYGQTVDVSFKVTVGDDLTGIDEVANKATVTDPENPGDPKEPESPPVPTDPVRDFTAAKTVADANGDGNAQAGEELTYTISIENTGDETLTGMTIADPIPAGTSYIDASADNGGTYDAASGTVNWTIDVPYGQTVDVSFKVTVGDNLTGIDEVANKATVTDPENPGDPKEPESPPVPTDPVRDFTAVKTVTDASGDGKAQAGEELTYTISIENTGDEDLTGMTISDPIPAGTSYLEASATNGGTLTSGALNWTVDIPFGETLNISFKVTVTDNLTGVTGIANTATVTDPENPDKPQEPATPPIPADPVRGFETAKTVTDAAGDGNARAGEELTYIITITNTGDVDLTGVTVTDPVPEHTAYVDGSADKDGVFEENKLNWTIAVPFGESKSVSFKVTVTGNLTGIGEITNIATVSDPENPDKPQTPSSPDLPTFIPDPTAHDDEAEVETNDETIIAIIDNDESYGSPLDPSTIEIIDEPLHGTVTVNPDGTVTYIPDPLYAGNDNFTYHVRDEDGNWSNVAVVDITVVPRALNIPNLFTPNGDGRNDTFAIPGLEGFPDNQLFIVNRWGNEVFRQVNYKNTWTGEGLNEGTYYYVLRFKDGSGKEQIYKGYITLVRTFVN